MRLLSMPFIIKQLVIQHLSIHQLFFLSLCSKNTKNFIKYTQKYQFERSELHRINYIISHTCMAIAMGVVSPTRGKRLILLYQNPKDLMARIPGYKESDTIEEVQLNELGLSFDVFRSPIHRTDLHAKYTSENAESIIQSIHNHLCDMLPRDPVVGVMTTFVGAKVLLFQNIQNIRWLEVHGGDDRINECLSRYSCLKILKLWGTEPKDIKFEENSKVYQLDTLDVQECLLATDALKYFNGRHVFLQSDTITAPDVIQFLNAWKSGEKFQNLEVICVEHVLVDFEVLAIRESVVFKVINTSVEYSYTRKQMYKPSDYKFESHLYMVRKSDGCVASVLFDDTKMLMGVWKITENEFLEKFQKSIR